MLRSRSLPSKDSRSLEMGISSNWQWHRWCAGHALITGVWKTLITPRLRRHSHVHTQMGLILILSMTPLYHCVCTHVWFKGISENTAYGKAQGTETTWPVQGRSLHYWSKELMAGRGCFGRMGSGTVEGNVWLERCQELGRALIMMGACVLRNLIIFLTW